MRIYRVLISLSLISFVAACGGKQSTPSDSATQPTPITEPAAEAEPEAAPASVRFVHAAAAPPAKFSAGGENLSGTLQPRTFTPQRVTVPAGAHTLVVGPSGGGEQFASRATTLGAGGNYTVIAIGGGDFAAQFVIEQDNLAAPAAGQARVRFVHGLSGTGALSFGDGAGRGFAAGLNYGSASGWYDVSGTGPLSIAVSDGSNDVTEISVPVAAGMLFTVVVVPDGDNARGLVVTEQAN